MKRVLLMYAASILISSVRVHSETKLCGFSVFQISGSKVSEDGTAGCSMGTESLAFLIRCFLKLKARGTIP